MKKILAIILAVLLLGLCSAVAEEPLPEAADFSPAGTWYREMNGFILVLTLEEGGTYTLSVTGGEGTQGVWELQNGYIILDGERDVALTFLGETLYSRDGRQAFFRRMPETYQPAPAAEIHTFEVEGIQVPTGFAGAWKSEYVLMGGTAVPASSLDDNTILYFESTRVMILGDVFGEIIADFAYADNALRMEEDGISFVIQPQEDGFMRFTATAGETELVFILAPYMTEEFPLGEESDEEIDIPMP